MVSREEEEEDDERAGNWLVFAAATEMEPLTLLLLLNRPHNTVV